VSGIVLVSSLGVSWKKTMQASGEKKMSLTIWLPLLFAVGMVTFGVLFAFVAACDRV